MAGLGPTAGEIELSGLEAVKRMEDNEMVHEKIFSFNTSKSGAQVGGVMAGLSPTVGGINIEMRIDEKKMEEKVLIVREMKGEKSKSESVLNEKIMREMRSAESVVMKKEKKRRKMLRKRRKCRFVKRRERKQRRIGRGIRNNWMRV